MIQPCDNVDEASYGDRSGYGGYGGGGGGVVRSGGRGRGRGGG